MGQDREAGRMDVAARQAMHAALAMASGEDLARLWLASKLEAVAAPVRGPETGLVTLRGRMGGGGAAFNVGEATVTRATVRLATGEVGHAWLLGRDQERARLAAIVDAVWQNPARRPVVEAKILSPLRDAVAAEDGRKRAQTAATKVDFFTMVRGED